MCTSKSIQLIVHVAMWFRATCPFCGHNEVEGVNLEAAACMEGIIRVANEQWTHCLRSQLKHDGLIIQRDSIQSIGPALHYRPIPSHNTILSLPEQFPINSGRIDSHDYAPSGQ